LRELRERLGKLSFEQLRDLSDEFEISVPDAKKKRDFIEAIVKSEKVLPEDVDEFVQYYAATPGAAPPGEGEDGGAPGAAPAPAPGPAAPAAAPAPAPAASPAHAPAHAASTAHAPSPSRPSEAGSKEPHEMDDEIRSHLAMPVDLTGAEDAVLALKAKFERGDHHDVPRHAKEVLKAAQDALQRVERIGYAYIISSSEKVLGDIEECGVDIAQAKGILNRAKRAFRDPAKEMGATVHNLEGEIEKLKVEQVSKLKDRLGSVKQFLEDAKKIDAEVLDSEEIVTDAERLFEDKNFVEALNVLREAEEAIEEAYKERIQGITHLVMNVEEVISNAAAMGADVTEARELHRKAKEAFKTKDYVSCIEMLKDGEAIAAKKLEEKFKQAMDIKEKQKTKLEERLVAVVTQVNRLSDEGIDTTQLDELVDEAKLALDEDNLSAATNHIRTAESLLRKAKRGGKSGEGASAHPPAAAPSPPAPAAPPPATVAPAPRAAPATQPAAPAVTVSPGRPAEHAAHAESAAPAQPELLPIQRPCKWCGYRGVEYYSNGIAKCPGCNRTYQWK
jgi:hypothetical protein